MYRECEQPYARVGEDEGGAAARMARRGRTARAEEECRRVAARWPAVTRREARQRGGSTRLPGRQLPAVRQRGQHGVAAPLAPRRSARVDAAALQAARHGAAAGTARRGRAARPEEERGGAR